MKKKSDWLLAVIKFKNAYFLCEFETDMQKKDEQNMTPEHRSFCYYGHKFEEYVPKNNTSTESLNPSKQFAGVFQATIGSYRLLYGAEMDCVVEKSSSITEHIELKVCAGKSLDDLPFKHNRKFAKWWIQCFLVEHVTNEYSHIHKDVVLFHFLPSSQTITMTKSSDSKYHFLSDWFFNQFI
ncbi:unnamed protein product [Rotaria sordida]|uniref:Decapping nuclease n=1 Tax=Rotaria sordida TaxID=392033 RepID=A0A815WVK2_9BILA|nr:unnamed protein product [Rotaria sordida]CAF1550306.1 unnamed protein product [Rotaria sordida]